MEILFDKQDELNAKLKISLKEEDYLPQVNSKLKEYSKNIQLKGFRPGKVPAALVNKMYGKSILLDEINELINKSIQSYIKDNSLEILGDPLPESNDQELLDLENKKEFDFTFQLGLVPKYTYDLKKLSVTKNNIQIDEKLLNKTLENLKLQFGTTEEVEKVEAKDTVSAEIQNAGLEDKKGTLIMEKLTDKAQKALLGKKIGDTLEMDVKSIFTEDFQINHFLGIAEEDWKNMNEPLKLKINEIKRQIPAAMEQEFFDKVFGASNVQDEATFLERLKNEISINYQRETEQLLNFNIKSEAIKTFDFELPKGFIKKWLLTTNKKNELSEDQLEKDFDNYLEGLKWTLFNNRVAKDFELSVSDEEIKDYATRKMLSQFGMNQIAEEHKAMFDQIIDKQLKADNYKLLYQTHGEVLSQKVYALISNQANITEKTINVEEFEEIVKSI